ncbi:sensor histidine kinase [Sphingomonas aerophila]|uniref:histidine kinase n=1 Tax=Sphingomonas aerophila TaxID=1344948 RepID=A0A7W9B9N3_9SPHN|nr:histidine kinase dimerization/phosphoacceptor domain -containing protein [Sphingomonas aerophila]MBB5713190.1 PAS domain S-box-containing protein [Sphingomonas aerophila]
MPDATTPFRVLLVDDNPGDRALVVRELRRDHAAAEIIEAGTPEELAQALSGDGFSLGVFDYSIGWTNGVEVLKRMRAIDPDVPVILFTGSLGEEEAAEAIKIGFDDFILKSIDRLPRLRSSIDALLKQKAERQARKRAEARYRALFQNVTVSIFATNNSGEFQDANSALARQLCLPSVESVEGRSILDFMVSEDAQTLWRKMATGELADGISGLEVELKGCPEPSWALLDAHPVDESRRQIVGVLTNVTELRNALEQRSVLLGEVHHRVHNNLQIVQSLLVFQARRFNDPAVQAAFTEVASRIQTLSLVQQQLYRDEDYSAVDFPGYLKSLVDALSGMQDRPEIDLLLDIEPIRVPIEKAVPLGLIANELLTNAMKHAFPDSRAGELRVSFKREGERIALAVADNGIGITSEPKGGEDSGLGSRLVPRLARQLQAEVTTASNGGYETVIRFAA